MSISRFFVKAATVETYVGPTGYGGANLAAPVVLDPTLGNGCWVDNSTKLVLGADGIQVVSNSRLYTYVANAALFTPNTRVTIDTVISHVIVVNVNDSGVLKLPDHIQIELL
jgi:hypothetical protein